MSYQLFVRKQGFSQDSFLHRPSIFQESICYFNDLCKRRIAISDYLSCSHMSPDYILAFYRSLRVVVEG